MPDTSRASPPRSARVVLVRFLAVLGITLLSMLAVEGLVRLSTRVSPAMEAAAAEPGMREGMPGIVGPDAEIGYGLVPGYDGIREGAPIRITINSLGMRDREYASPSHANGQRFILAGGDSFSFGAGVEVDETYLSQLERILREEDGSWTVVKTGVPGYSVPQSASQVRRHLDRFAPRLVIVQMIPDTEDRNISPRRAVGGVVILPREGLHYHPVGDLVLESPFPPGALATLDVLASGLSSAYRVARRVVIEGVAPDDVLEPEDRARARQLALDALVDLDHEVRRRGGRLLVVLNHWARESLSLMVEAGPLHQSYVELLGSAGIEVFDTLPAFIAESEGVSYLGLSPTDGHWNEAGHRFAAEILADHLLEEGLLEW